MPNSFYSRPDEVWRTSDLGNFVRERRVPAQLARRLRTKLEPIPV
jgi:hypothetical protein